MSVTWNQLGRPTREDIITVDGIGSVIVTQEDIALAASGQEVFELTDISTLKHPHRYQIRRPRRRDG